MRIREESGSVGEVIWEGVWCVMGGGGADLIQHRPSKQQISSTLFTLCKTMTLAKDRPPLKYVSSNNGHLKRLISLTIGPWLPRCSCHNALVCIRVGCCELLQLCRGNGGVGGWSDLKLL